MAPWKPRVKISTDLALQGGTGNLPLRNFEDQLALDPLTGRELDVLRLMAAGRTTRQIADELVVTVGTVRWYAKRIYGKLGVHSRSQAALRARDLGLFVPGDVGTSRRRPPRARFSLPRYPTPFVGREDDLDELVALLTDPSVRLVTIAGAAGMGCPWPSNWPRHG